MTFLVLPSWLAWLLMGLAAAAAAGLFLIRPRPPRRVIASLVVWRRVLEEQARRSWRDRVRWIVSLLLTAAIAAAIAAAFARPARGGATGRVLIVLDSSWTMRAERPAGDTRWAEALRRARRLVRASGAGQVALATTADGLVQGPTADVALLESVFDRLQPTGGADAAWPALSGLSRVHFFTDGALPRLLPDDVVVHRVFEPVANVAVTAFEVETEGAPAGMANVFVAVANYATTSQAVRLTVGRAAVVLRDRVRDVGPGEAFRETFAVPVAGDPRFRAHVSAAGNALALDDDGSAWLWPAAPLRVAVVGAHSTIAALLTRDASLQVSTIDPAGYAGAAADVWVFDGWLPDQPPARPMLAIDPPASRWFGTRGPEEIDPIWREGTTHSVLEGFDPALVQIGRARSIVRAELQPVALSERGTPLVAVEDSLQGRRVAFTFALAETNLGLTPAFPILIGNVLDWLGRPARGRPREPGPALLPADTVRVLAPDGTPIALARIAGRVSAVLSTPGLYLVQSRDGQSVLPVTLGDVGRSNLLVSESAPAQDGPGGTDGTDAPDGPGRPWWMGIAAVALVLATAEWLTWLRRITV